MSPCSPIGTQTRHIDSECRCLGQQTTGETASPLLTLERGRGRGEGHACSPPALVLIAISPANLTHLNSKHKRVSWPLLDLDAILTEEDHSPLFSQTLESPGGLHSKVVPQSPKDLTAQCNRERWHEVKWLRSVRQESWHGERHAQISKRPQVLLGARAGDLAVASLLSGPARSNCAGVGSSLKQWA